MALDVNTLFYLTMYVEAILGLLLFLAWAQNLGTRALAWWGTAHLLRSLSIALYGLHGAIPALASIDLASALLFASFGLMWTGARVFDERSTRPGSIALGAMAWLLASQFAAFSELSEMRTVLATVIVVAFSWATAWEFWRGRREGLVSRWPAVVLLFAHGILFLLRTPLSDGLSGTTPGGPLSSAWITVVSAEALLFSVAIAFMMLAVGKERAEFGHRAAALLDPLTGLFNRRGFMQDGETLTRAQTMRGRPVAVFLIDLDHFKGVNDRFGHAIGDRVLQIFAEVTSSGLRSSDLVGRLGGEEFGVLLADASRDNAFLVAERVRSMFESAAKNANGHPVAATISVGVAIIQDPRQNLDTLLEQADRALYMAKAKGRNRVELAPIEDPQALPATTQISGQLVAG